MSVGLLVESSNFNRNLYTDFIALCRLFPTPNQKLLYSTALINRKKIISQLFKIQLLWCKIISTSLEAHVSLYNI